MPYIAINTNKTLFFTQREAIKSKLGELIAIIPGKSQRTLMVDFSEGHSMYLAGEEGDIAFVDIRLLGEAPLEKKEAFTVAVFDLLRDEAGLDPDHVYINISEHQSWGLRGMLKTV